jgi:hypothetical protein
MPDLRKVVIEIVTSQQTADDVQNKTVTNEKDTTTKKTQGELIKGILVHEGLELAKDTLVRTLDTTIGNYLSMTENYIGEQNYQNAKSAVSKAKNLVTSVGSGFALGGGFTPAGFIGAGIGLISWGAGEYFSIRERNSQYAQSLNASAYQRQFMGTRYGLVNEGRGTEN